jgi:hypothetical protein
MKGNSEEHFDEKRQSFQGNMRKQPAHEDD